MSNSFSGSHPVRCGQCQHSFTQTHWRPHGHNPDQAICQVQACRRRAVGHRFTGGVPELLCGGHLLEAQRGGGQVTFVDGRVCRVCDGHGRVHAQEMRVDSPGGEWRSCPECLGTGYDPSLRSRVPHQRDVPPQRVEERTPSTPSPAKRDSRAERRAREAKERAARSEWFDREVAPLADELPDPIVAWQRARDRARPPNTPPPHPRQTSPAGDRAGSQVPRLAPGSRAEDIRAFEREARYRRRRGRGSNRRGSVASTILFAGMASLAGAAVGVLFIYPVLPDDALVLVSDLQHWVSERFAR